MSAASMPDPEADILGMRPAEFYRLVQRDVERELEQRLPQHIANESLLDIYTRWLVFQIPNLGHLSHEHSSETIRRGCDYLSSRNYNKGLVLSAFSRHKDLYIRDHPQGRRAFNFARRDIEINFKSLPRLPSNPGLPSTRSTSPSSKTTANPAKSVLSQTQSTMATPITESPEKFRPASEDQNHCDRQKLFALFEEPRSRGLSSTQPSKKMPVLSSAKTRTPPANYICNRCGIPGHFISECPTNGNHRLDRRPPSRYVCRICGEARTHYVRDCPQYVAGSNSESMPFEGRSMSVSNIFSRRDSGGRTIVPSDEGRAGSCQMSIDPFNTDTPVYSTSLATGSLGGTAHLSLARQTESSSVGKAPKLIDDFMNEDRARYIHSHTENSQSESQDTPTQTGGHAKFGSNTKPIAPRRHLDSYRPTSFHHDSYRPGGSSRGEDTYRPDDLYRPGETRRSVHHNEPGRQNKQEGQDGRLSPYHADYSLYDEPSDYRDRLDHRESPGRWDEPRRGESPTRPNGSCRTTGSYHPDGSKRRGQINTRKVIEKKTVSKETTVYSLPKRKRSDGRLSPWDDVHPPAKKPRRQDTLDDGLPRDDIETPRKNNQGDFADSPTTKQFNVVDTEPASTVDPKKAVSGTGVFKKSGDSTDAEWEQAGTEADAFLQALGGELVECPGIEASADSREVGSSDSPIYSPASPVSSVDQHHPPEELAPGDGEDFPMADFLDDIAEPTRRMSLETDEDQPRSDPVIIPFYTLKSRQRDPPCDPGVLNLFRHKKNSHVYINVTRRRKAIDFYNETEEERATMRMSHCSLTTSRSSGSS